MESPAPPAWSESGASGAEGSMPTPEEIQTDAMIRDVNRNMTMPRKKLLYVVGAAILVLAVIVGASAGAAKNKNAPTASSSSSVNIQRPHLFLGPRESGVDVNAPRVQATFKFLADWVHGDILAGDTAQRASALWLAGLDPRVVPVPEGGAGYADSFVFMQRWILGVFWYSMDGFHWTEQMDFMSHHSECHWNFDLPESSRPEGVDSALWKYGVMCEDGKSVSHIRITANNMNGQLPRELGLLVAMKQFSVYGNEIYGPLPDSLQFWEKLEFLAAENNVISGSLPDWISKWTNMKYLALGNNQLGGQVPSFSTLKSLREVSLEMNKFTGGVDSFNDCTSLKKLIINDNKLNGALSESSFANLSLDLLDLSNNNLVGSIPEHFYTIKIVDLHSNAIGGFLPVIDFNAALNVEFLSIHGNQVAGPMPEDIGFLEDLVLLDLSNNRLSGAMPASLANLAELRYLYLANNPFTAGSFPELWSLSHLREVAVRNTQRTGVIPTWLGNLHKLVLLDMAENSMTGTIPITFGALLNLRFLFLNRNAFNGPIPAELSGLKSLDVIMLDKNDFVGSVGDICVAGVGPSDIDRFVADCDITCDCCTKCCNDNDSSCNSESYLANIEDGYERNQFVFSEDIIYSANSSPDN